GQLRDQRGDVERGLERRHFREHVARGFALGRGLLGADGERDGGGQDERERQTADHARIITSSLRLALAGEGKAYGKTFRRHKRSAGETRASKLAADLLGQGACACVYLLHFSSVS